jgi:hypothetical protein
VQDPVKQPRSAGVLRRNIVICLICIYLMKN